MSTVSESLSLAVLVVDCQATAAAPRGHHATGATARAWRRRRRPGTKKRPGDRAQTAPSMRSASALEEKRWIMARYRAVGRSVADEFRRFAERAVNTLQRPLRVETSDARLYCSSARPRSCCADVT
jgi:hypothetical protein